MKQLSSLLKISVSFLFIFSVTTASGGDPYRPSAGAGEAGMGYVCVMRDAFWSSFHNQALLSENKRFSAGFNYENRFSIKELGTRSAAMVIPAWKTSIGFVYNCFGYTDFKREMTGIACGLKLTDRIAAGVQVDYFSERTSGEYDKNQSVTFEAGLLIAPSETVRIGIHIFNPVPNSLRKSYIPSILRAGAGTYLGKTLFAGLEAEISSSSKLIIRSGFEYEAAKDFRVRGGYSTDNNSFSFGLGYLLKGVSADIGFTAHEKLGISSSASLVFKIR